MIGDFLGPYRVVAKLGEGGMGVVYRAHDPRLGRDVAIKVLPEAFARDAERMARFEREARTLASLNHPNIAMLHGLEQGALVMELVEGDALRCPVPEETAIVYARQIADALEHAHEKGITHRDLKPANVRITPDGQAKLLDFGLAKAMDAGPSPAGGDPENSPTLTAPLSSSGLIMGTAGYMSPEQARGARVDHRTDIWAFGVVMYEMLTGRSPFKGETVSDTLAAILKTDPDLAAIPARFQPLLRRCLERDVRKRLGWIGEVRPMLDAAPPTALPPRRGVPRWALAIMAAGGLAAGWLLWHRQQAAPPLRAFSFTPDALSTVDYAHRAVISPDGKHIAYVAANRLWIRDLASEQARTLEGTENAVGPFWSPDSGQVAFVAGGEMKRSSVNSGAPFTLAALPGAYRGGTWSPDGRTIVFSSFGGLFEIPAEGGASRKVFPNAAGEAFYSPQFLPSTPGERVMLASRGSIAAQSLQIVNLRTGKTETLRPGAYPAYAASGHILFQAGPQVSGLWALALAPGTLKTAGEPIPIVNEAMDVSASADGTLLWCTPTADENLQLVWRDRSGSKLSVSGAPSRYLRNLELSPDGTRAAFAANQGGNIDVWIQDLTRSSKTRFTFGPELEGSPKWSPSGKEIAFAFQKSGTRGISIQPVDGSGEPRMIGPGATAGLPASWSPDGTTLLFGLAGPKGFDLWYSRRRPDGSFEGAAAFLNSEFIEQQGRFSPDGRSVLYVSNETGRNEVYVRSFPDAASKRQISTDGGYLPRWRKDGNEIYYVNGNALLAVPLHGGAAVELFRNPGLPSAQGFHTYDAAPDGKRFLVAEPVDDGKSAGRAIHIVENWTALLRPKLAATKAE